MIIFDGYKGILFNWVLKFFNFRNRTGLFISKGSRISQRTIIGDGSRINGKIIIKGRGVCEIGKYVAFGDGIKIITSNHNLNQVNLQYALSKKIGILPKHDSKMGVIIGHNVWIGDNVIILPGVKVCNGAVIGAGSVVTKNVQAYAVVSGVPARLRKFRFSQDKIDEIERTSWWNWSTNEMRNNIDFFA